MTITKALYAAGAAIAALFAMPATGFVVWAFTLGEMPVPMVCSVWAASSGVFAFFIFRAFTAR